MKKLQELFDKWKSGKSAKNADPYAEKAFSEKEEAQKIKKELNRSLKINVDTFRKILGESTDIKIREFMFGSDSPVKAALIFIDGMVNNEIITESIMKPLMLSTMPLKSGSANLVDEVQQRIICSGDVVVSANEKELIDSCLGGDTVLLIDGFQQGLIISSKGWEKRSVTEPQTAAVVRGPREGFTENYRTNTSLLRRKIRNPALRMDTLKIGRKTRTTVSIAYLEGVADPALIKEIKRRLSALEVDSILESGYIEQYIEDAPYSIFPTIGKSEKPDVVAAKILEGRAAILVDGTPFVLTAPMLFVENFQTAEDYYTRTFYATSVRILRFLSFFIAVFSPGIYVAISTFHQELIPIKLLFTIAAARSGTPFPVVIEGLLLLLAFEILREAGLRLPQPIGQAVSIVGALVMGDAAVSAGLVGTPMVVTVAISAMAEFVTPENQDVITLLRFAFLLAGSFLGGFGIMLGTLALLIHIASLESFGVPYFSGIAPVNKQNMEDIFVRAHLWSMTKRPTEIAHSDVVRQKGKIPPDETDLNE
ncbi:MAG: spore germination protein [Oscillospiraceae bacterium]|jgi:spore germination protein KA|nr:spore germination protein [Oscillospiraceae bacterium]